MTRLCSHCKRAYMSYKNAPGKPMCSEKCRREAKRKNRKPVTIEDPKTVRSEWWSHMRLIHERRGKPGDWPDCKMCERYQERLAMALAEAV